MKKISYFLALLGMISAVACNTKIDPVGPNVVPGTGECLLTCSFGDIATKVASQSVTNEKSIQNVQIFVFRAGTDNSGNPAGDFGNLEIAASAGFDTPLNVTTGSYSGITVRSSTGVREVWAIVNDSKDRTVGTDAVATKDEFLALRHDLANSNPSKLLMLGRSNPEGQDPAITLVEGAQQVQIPVHRLAASVVLESVVNDFSSPAYQKAGMFRVDACYLLNVPGEVNFAESLLPISIDTEKWYAKQAAATAAPLSAILYDDMGPTLVQYGSTYNTKHTFYSYPNNCAPSEAEVFSPRATILVLEASIDYNAGKSGVQPNWVKYYYPVVISKKVSDSPETWAGLEANKQYHVNLTIHRPGSLDPNKPVRFNDATPVITVSDWTDGDTYNPEI